MSDQTLFGKKISGISHETGQALEKDRKATEKAQELEAKGFPDFKGNVILYTLAREKPTWGFQVKYVNLGTKKEDQLSEFEHRHGLGLVFHQGRLYALSDLFVQDAVSGENLFHKPSEDYARQLFSHNGKIVGILEEVRSGTFLVQDLLGNLYSFYDSIAVFKEQDGKLVKGDKSGYVCTLSDGKDLFYLVNEGDRQDIYTPSNKRIGSIPLGRGRVRRGMASQLKADVSREHVYVVAQPAFSFGEEGTTYGDGIIQMNIETGEHKQLLRGEKVTHFTIISEQDLEELLNREQ